MNRMANGPKDRSEMALCGEEDAVYDLVPRKVHDLRDAPRYIVEFHGLADGRALRFVPSDRMLIKESRSLQDETDRSAKQCGKLLEAIDGIRFTMDQISDE